MPSDDNIFTAEFNKGLADVETVTAATFEFPAGKKWPAIAVDDMRLTNVAGAAGGLLAQVNVSVYIRKEIQAASKVIKGSVIVARSQRARVLTVADDGDDAVTLMCGPPGAQMPV
jgi:hypothetical protein